MAVELAVERVEEDLEAADLEVGSAEEGRVAVELAVELEVGSEVEMVEEDLEAADLEVGSVEDLEGGLVPPMEVVKVVGGMEEEETGEEAWGVAKEVAG